MYSESVRQASHRARRARHLPADESVASKAGWNPTRCFRRIVGGSSRVNQTR
jgi:hypothetical protein